MCDVIKKKGELMISVTWQFGHKKLPLDDRVQNLA